MTFDLPLTTLPPSALDPILARLLAAATVAETTAHGSRRRQQFRITRRLISAMRKHGVSASDIAESLGRSAHSVRARGHEDGAISASDFSALSGVPIAHIAEWEGAGQLPTPVTEIDGYTGYPASSLVATFAAQARSR